MSIIPVQPDNFEYFTLETSPTRTYVASEPDATTGEYSNVTGTLYLFNRRSHMEKEPRDLSAFLSTTVKEGTEGDVDGLLSEAKQAAMLTGNNYKYVAELLTKTNALPASIRRQQTVDVVRLEPSFELDHDHCRKQTIRTTLYRYYRDIYPSLQWAYSNYHTLNFFTGSSVATDTVFMYPNTAAGDGIANNVYLPQAGFSFDFRINPRYSTPQPTDTFTPGTIFHMSGVFALSLLSGTHRDVNGYVDGYRLGLQVLSGAHVPPLLATAGNSVFWTDDNVLTRNRWHHVVVRWGGTSVNNGVGNFVVDGVTVGNFTIPSSTLTTDIGVSPDIMYVGNFYEGPSTGSNLETRFFSTTAASRDGLIELQSDPVDGPIDSPLGAVFRHPLNAELHELRLWNHYISDAVIASCSVTAPTIRQRGDLMFNVPPFFTPESPRRTVVNGAGGVLQTPFQAMDTTTDDPFNVALSFGVGTRYMNVENFTRDFARSNYPRAFNLTASQLNETTDLLTATQFLYALPAVRKRNLTILPCDDGWFTPDYSLLTSGTMVNSPASGTLNFKYTNDLGNYDASVISLTDLISSSSFFGNLIQLSGSLSDAITGATPEDPGVDPGDVLTIFQRTRDNSSNEVTIFDVSNLYYGNRILPGTVVITDSAATGSAGRIGFELRDDGAGGLYRADTIGDHAKWSTVGNVIYDEGIIVITSPAMPYFGRDQYSVEFKASHNIHVFKVSVTAPGGLITSSSNPSYRPISASLDANEYDPKFVYITGINYHDENLNVVMKTTLAQPVIKRTGERIQFKSVIDF